MLFSATMTEDVEQLVAVSLRRPVRLAADVRDRAPSQLAQEIVRLKVGKPDSIRQSLTFSAPCPSARFLHSLLSSELK